MQLSRARSLSPLSLFALLALFLTSTSAAVLGIDLGTEYIKAYLPRPGVGVDIVLTKDSRRKEAAAIAFKPVKSQSSFTKDVLPERNYGADAIALSARFPGDTFQNIKSLLGLPFTDSAVASFQERYPGVHISQDEDRGRVQLSSAAFDQEERPFLVEELLAMEFQNIAANAEAMGTYKIKDVILTVPAYWTVEEKDALQSAAELADLNVVGLITDGLAVGLNYAVGGGKSFPVINEPGTTNKPEYHIIYDMGAGATTATILKLQGRIVKDVGKRNKTVHEVQVAGVGWDKTLGGDAMNTYILNDMLDQLADHPKIKAIGATRSQIAKDGRTVNKLWKEGVRIRQVLSANSQTQASFEAIYHEDVTFKYKLSRADFEKMTEGLVGRVKSPIDQAMHFARLEFSDIDSIIVHGGAQRTPFVQKELESLLGKAEKVRNNVNSDEAAAYGAAFLGAMSSASFRLNKEIRISEIGIHDVWVSWNQDGKEKRQKIFTESSVAGKAKQLPFKTAANELTFDIFQQVLDGDNMRNIPVWTVTTTNMTKAVTDLTETHGCTLENIKTEFEVFLTTKENLPDVVRGTLSCEVLDDKKGGIVDGIKGFFGGKKEGQQPLKDQDAETVSTTADTSSGSATSATASASVDSKEAKEPKKRTEYAYVGVLTDSVARKKLPHTELFRLRDRLSAFKRADLKRAQRAEALNQLESYAYKVRDWIESETFIAASTEAIRNTLVEKASQAGEWIYGDGSEAEKSEFDKRLQELKDIVKPILKRRKESADRPTEIETLETAINSTKSFLTSFKSSAEEAVKKASASAEAAASSVSSAVSSVASGEDPDDLDDEEATPTPSLAAIPPPVFKPEDFDKSFEKLEAVSKWLSEKLAAQAKLLPTDDAAMTVAEIQQKGQELNKITTDILSKQIQAARKDEAAKSKSKPKSKSKTKTAKTKKITVSEDSSTTATEESASATSEAATQQKPKDEL